MDDKMSETAWEGRACHEFKAEQWIPLPPDKLFLFFSDEKNLERLTPPWLHFHVIGKSTPAMQTGTLIDYRLRIRSIPVRWQSRIDEWTPPARFVDEQTRGPYSLWHHTHSFEPKDGGTLATDHVRYRVPGWLLGRLLILPMVKRDIQTIFNYRRTKIDEMFGGAK
jgi:ligand-binding SRPBCC domain-containing protein